MELCERDRPTQEAGIATKAVWFGTELFGKLAAVGKPPVAASTVRSSSGRLSTSEVGARLQADWDRQYFITGAIDLEVYDEDCEFADPFVSFRGLKRFKDNLDNLGSFITDSEVRLLSFEADGESRFVSRAVVKLQLGLPWKPVLAWVWGVAYELDEKTGLVSRHLESWEVSAADGVSQLFSPGKGSLRGK